MQEYLFFKAAAGKKNGRPGKAFFKESLHF
jgi:hypothetical protein